MINVSHAFVSTKPEQTDPTIIGPNEWNALHVVNDTHKIVYVSDYNFTPQSPGGNLVVGANTIAMNPMPSGINSSSINNAYVMISGGVGAAEACPIIGVSGNNLTITCGNTHSGAWTISSSSTGLQEALIGNTSGFICIDSLVTVAGPVTVLPGRIGLFSAGRDFIAIQRAANYLNNYLIKVPQGADISIHDMFINDIVASQQTSGAAVFGGFGAGFVMYNIGGSFGYAFVELDAVGGFQLIHANISNYGAAFDGLACFNIHNTHNSAPTNLYFQSVYTSCTQNTRAWHVTSCDGLQIKGCGTGNASFGVVLSPPTGLYTVNVTIEGNFIDGIRTSGVYFGGPGAIINVKIVGNHIHAEGMTTSNFGIDLGYSAGSNPFNTQIIGNNIQGMGDAGIAIGGHTTLALIEGNEILDNNASGLASQGGVYVSGTPDHLVISNNVISAPGQQTPQNQFYGINFNAAPTFFVCTGNILSGNVTGPINGNVGLTSVIANNEGVDDVVPVVASNATLTPGFNPSFRITGTTNVTAINGGWINRRLKIYKTDAGSVTVMGKALASGTAIDLYTPDGVNWF